MWWWLFLLGVTNAAVCHICGVAGNDAIKYPHIVVEPLTRKTCVELSLQYAMTLQAGTPPCAQIQSVWWYKCCSGIRPDGVNRPPSQLPEVPIVRYLGPHPACKICRNGNYPGNTSMVINMLYLGADTCARYYVHGLEGRIPAHLCSALQYFAYEPCSCSAGQTPPNSPRPPPPRWTRPRPPSRPRPKLGGDRGGAGGVRRGK